MSATDIPYLKLFRGDAYQPRWEPGPKLRRSGLRGRALKSDAGTWLEPEAARAEARRLNTEAEQIIAEARRVKHGPKRHPRCVGALWDLYTRSPRWQKLSAGSRADYTSKVQPLLAKFGDTPVAALSKAHLHTWWEGLYAERGHAMANGILSVTRLLLSYGEMKGWIAHNPALKLGLEGVEPRVVVWLPAEAERFVALADHMKLPGVADAFVLALHTSQRLGDVLSLAEEKVEPARVRFRQAKTGARVTVPLTDALAARLAEIRRRRTSGAVVELARTNRPIVERQDGSAYDRFAFNRDFRTVRDALADELPDVATREFRDLRDTAITRLAEAGCSIQEIAAISGHSLQTIHTVMRHYLALSEAMAVRGIDRLQTWMREEGIAV